jgi:hypothetical protein
MSPPPGMRWQSWGTAILPMMKIPAARYVRYDAKLYFWCCSAIEFMGQNGFIGKDNQKKTQKLFAE